MEVGASLFVVEGYDYGKKNPIGYKKVVSVGRIYFKLEGIPDKFRINNWAQNTDYSAYYSLYESEYEYTKTLRSSRILHHLRNAPLSKDTLIKIGDVLNIE